jgi:Uma2 family endonuclease
MIANAGLPRMTPQEYLAWEENQPLRYEYFRGEVVAMTGGTIPHNQVAVNLAALLKSHLRGKGCKVLTSDAKVAISEQGPFHYADVSVTCDPRDRTARKYIRYPRLIVEVLSPSTEAIDRGEKFRQYRRIATLQEYVLIDPDTPNLECYRLNERSNWELVYSLAGAIDGATAIGAIAGEVYLASVDLTVSLALLYEDIDWGE